MAPKLPPPATPTPLLPQWRAFLLCGNFSSFTAPSQRGRSPPYSFGSAFYFFFCPTQVYAECLSFWEIWGLLPAFSRCSVRVVPHVDVFLMYLSGGRWSPHLARPPSWRSTPLCYFLYQVFCKLIYLAAINFPTVLVYYVLSLILIFVNWTSKFKSFTSFFIFSFPRLKVWSELAFYFQEHIFFASVNKNVMIETIIQEQLQPRGCF